MSAVAPGPTPAKSSTSFISKWGLVAGAAALVVIIMLPQPAGLSIAGQHMLGIFAFAVIIWMTESVEYAASSLC
jgi:solute carrier family 13 (sodium-dependent dicarboxylate transporter), member 2/3/5